MTPYDVWKLFSDVFFAGGDPIFVDATLIIYNSL